MKICHFAMAYFLIFCHAENTSVFKLLNTGACFYFYFKIKDFSPATASALNDSFLSQWFIFRVTCVQHYDSKQSCHCWLASAKEHHNDSSG